MRRYRLIWYAAAILVVLSLSITFAAFPIPNPWRSYSAEQLNAVADKIEGLRPEGKGPCFESEVRYTIAKPSNEQNRVVITGTQPAQEWISGELDRQERAMVVADPKFMHFVCEIG